MKKISLLFITLMISACNSQNKKKDNLNNPIKSKIMEKFDINKYKDWEIDTTYVKTEYDNFFRKDNLRVRITVDSENIQVEEADIYTPYKLTKVFSTESNILKSKLKEFYSVTYDKYQIYKQNGELEEEVDEDKPYKLSIEDIIQLMRKKYNIDLMDVSDRKSVDREPGDISNPPIYFISIPVKDSRSNRQITVNANDGSLIKDQIVNPDAKFYKNKK
jgi:hypothetical protein